MSASEIKTNKNGKLSGMLYDVGLLQALASAFGPSGCEGEVAALIKSQIEPYCPDIKTDRLGNLIARLPASAPAGAGKPGRVMLSAHMDEVGFMVNLIEGDGYLRFSTLGGIDPRVLCGRTVIVRGASGDVRGVIASKAIHHQTAEERAVATPVDQMYIDIGAANADDAGKAVAVGDFGTFAPNYEKFGENGAYIVSKALDDRLGCAVLVEVLRSAAVSRAVRANDLYFCFTVREEVGLSGAAVAANEIAPDRAYIIETTAVADIAGVEPAERVAELGSGGVISFADRGTVYDRQLFDKTFELAAALGIKAQVKRFVSGGNDAAHIQRSGAGAHVLAVSAPSRYIHSQTCVVAEEDYFSIMELVSSLISAD